MKLRINLIKYFANVIIIITTLSILGTRVEQDQTISFYKESYRQSILNIYLWKFILQLGPDHIFQTSWFIFLLGLFTSSLSCCTFLEQFPILNRSQKYFFYKKKIQYNRLPLNNKIKYTSSGNLVS